jgi:tetratricopeptide (TPR) repeat protein
MDSRGENRIRIVLDTPARRALAVAAGLLPAIIYVALAGMHFLAAELSASSRLVDLQWAARLDPWNGKYQDMLGRYYLFAAHRPDLALSSLRRAVALNSHNSCCWLDLAAASYQLENRSAAGLALNRAITVDPKTPNTAWEAANAYLALGETKQALRTFRVVMEGDPSLHAAALAYCWRLDPDAAALLADIIPPNSEATANFLEFLIVHNQRAAASAAWNRLVQLQQPVERGHVFNYLQYSIAQHDLTQAKSVWKQAADLAALSRYQPSPQNLVVNGDFQFAVLNAGFDWRYEQSPGVSLSLDPTQSRSGFRSLEISFDSRGIEDAGIRQLIPLDPNAEYEFSAYFRTEDLQGAGGPRFVIQDFLTGETYYSSDDLKSDLAWSQVQGGVATGPETQLVVLRIRRVPAGAAIRGKLWIDSVRLAPARTLAEVAP